MKKIISVAIIAVFAVSLSKEAAFALFDVSFWGVRALGMGGAFTAVADDANAPIYNVAGTGEMEKPEVTAMSSKLFVVEGNDMTMAYIGGVYPLSYEAGTLSLGWAHFGHTSIRNEDSVSLGYARQLDDLIALIAGEKVEWFSLMAGLNLKYLRQDINMNQHQSQGGELASDAFGLDIGVLARFQYGISVGYSGRYINSPEIGFGLVDEKDYVKSTNVLGLSYYSEELPFLKIPYFTAALDYEIRGGTGGNTLILGLESRVIDGKLALRAGGWESQLNFGLGYTFTFEGYGQLMLDYAFGLPLEMQGTAGSHFLSLSYRFE